MSGSREKRIERATKVPGGTPRLTRLKGETRYVETSESAIETALRIKRSAARRRAEQRMRGRGLI